MYKDISIKVQRHFMEFNTLYSWKAKRCIKLSWYILYRIWVGTWDHPLAHVASGPRGFQLDPAWAPGLVWAWSMQVFIPVSSPSWGLAFKPQNMKGMGWCLCTVSKVLNLVMHLYSNVPLSKTEQCNSTQCIWMHYRSTNDIGSPLLLFLQFILISNQI